MRKIIIVIFLFCCEFSSFGRVVLLKHNFAEQVEYNNALIEYVILETISDSTYNELISNEKNTLRINIDFNMYGIDRISISDNTCLSIKEASSICKALCNQENYPWLWGYFFELPSIPYNKSDYAQILESRNNTSDRCVVGSIGCLFFSNISAKNSRLDAIASIKCLINNYIFTNKLIIQKYGIEDTEYETFFNRIFLDECKKRKTIVSIELHDK